MDRRQRKTREAIFRAFTELVAKKDFGRITVSEIIERADVGRATFYAHFETKELLLKAFCEELFCHLFDTIEPRQTEHTYIFHCHTDDTVFLHLFRHLQKDDNRILTLFSGENNDLFLLYFKNGLIHLIHREEHLFSARKSDKLPRAFWVDHVASVFVETVRWWIANGKTESPEQITEYFFLSV